MQQLEAPTLADYIRNPRMSADELSVYSGGRDTAFQKLMQDVQVETFANNMLHDQAYRDSQKGTLIDVIFRGLGHDISSAPTPNLIEEATGLLMGPRRPDAPGEMMLRQFTMSKETQRFPFFNKPGKSQATSRGIADVNTRGDRHKWLDMKSDLEILTGDGVDLKYREDVDAYTIAHWAGSLGTQHHEDISQKCVDKIALADNRFTAAGTGTYTDASGNTASKGFLVDISSPLSFDGIAKTVTTARTNHVAADCMAINHEAAYTLFTSDDFKDADKFQALVDYGDLTLPMIMGVKVFTTAQINDDNGGNTAFWMWEKERYCFFLVRRYALVTAWEDKRENKEGLNYSTRYGFAVGDGQCILKCK